MALVVVMMVANAVLVDPLAHLLPMPGAFPAWFCEMGVNPGASVAILTP